MQSSIQQPIKRRKKERAGGWGGGVREKGEADRKEREAKYPTWSELFTSSVNLDLSLCSDDELLADLLSSGLGDFEHLDQRLILHKGPLGGGETEQQVVLQLLHLALVAGHLLQKVGALGLQLLHNAEEGEFSRFFFQTAVLLQGHKLVLLWLTADSVTEK